VRARDSRPALVVLAALIVTGCTPTSLPPMPGEYLGSYHFNGYLVVDAPSGPTTNCLLDGGLLFWPSTVDFFAQMSWLPDAGVIFWMIQNGPLIDGGFSGAEITATTVSPAQVSSCACVGEVAETVTLLESYGDGGGSPPDLTAPALYWNGLIQDLLTPTNELTTIVFDGGLSCNADAGPGCGLDCELVYAVSGYPGLP
jgi:hypothetical protein